MPGIPEDKIAEVRSLADIVRVVGRVVNLKKAGRSWKGCCPFHSEKTPSFYVHPEKQIFHCFGCQAGGDVFRFLMDHEGRTFPEAVRLLAEEVGVEIPEASGVDAARARAEKAAKTRLVDANAAAAEVFAAWLADPEAGGPGEAHLADRGIDPDTAHRFGLGYAPLRNDLSARLVGRGVDARTQEAAGLLARNDRGAYERFRGRLMIPIRPPGGRPVAFGARAVEGDHPAKYLNSPESPVYRKSEVLFGLDLAREHIRRRNAAVVVEGYFDVIALHQAGVEHAVATCGTALTEGHCRLLARHCKDVFLVFDGDAAGAQAAARAHEVVETVPSLVARVVRLPEGEDPDTFVRSRGAEAFERLCEQAVPVTEFLLDRALAGVGSSVEDRVRAVEAVRPILVRVRDRLARKLYVARVADRLGMNERTLVAYLRGEDADDRGPGRRAAQEAPAVPLPTSEEAVCRLVLEYPPLLARRHPALPEDVESVRGDFTHDGLRALLGSLVTEYAEHGSVDASAALSQLDDTRLASSWRAHVTGTAEQASVLDEADAARKLQLYLYRIRRDANRRRDDALRRHLQAQAVDPLVAARERNEIKAERRRLDEQYKTSPRQ